MLKGNEEEETASVERTVRVVVLEKGVKETVLIMATKKLDIHYLFFDHFPEQGNHGALGPPTPRSPPCRCFYRWCCLWTSACFLISEDPTLF